jgi:hypothetical protein
MSDNKATVAKYLDGFNHSNHEHILSASRPAGVR